MIACPKGEGWSDDDVTGELMKSYEQILRHSPHQSIRNAQFRSA